MCIRICMRWLAVLETTARVFAHGLEPPCVQEDHLKDLRQRVDVHLEFIPYSVLHYKKVSFTIVQVFHDWTHHRISTAFHLPGGRVAIVTTEPD